MNLFNIVAILITLSAAFGYLNHRFIRLPNTIGLMLISILMSLGLVIVGLLFPSTLGIEEHWKSFLQNIDFNKSLMVGMLGFLLFAGSLHVDSEELLRRKWEIGIFATAGVVISTFVTGITIYFVSGWLGLKLRFITSLLFGALISPTDPIAVLGILRKSGAPKSLEIIISGESLFNDGIGVVVFVILAGMASGSHGASFQEASLLFLEEAIGGFVLGLLLGWLAYGVLKSIDNYQVEILVTLALVTGGYALAAALHTSGPIAIVVAGLLIGNRGRKFAMSEKTRHNLDMFWELVDVILNSLLFVMIGLELLVVTLTGRYLIAGGLAVAVALLARLVSVGIPFSLMRSRSRLPAGTLKVMTWGGLRGGIAVALALSLPHGPERDIVITMTYSIVVFSILVQGLTIKNLVAPSMGERE
ncbi:MAG: sodium:proton antiporter [Candidatus Sulfobium sp.]|jgi:Na+:H+ antiporter